MGSQSVYVFPAVEERGFCARAIAKLCAAGTIRAGSRPPEHLARYGPGPTAEALLPDCFEYLGVRIAGRPRLIPEDPVEPRCPECGADLSEGFQETIAGELERDPDQDWAAVTVSCAGCGWSGALTAVDEDVGVYARREFLFFDDTQLADGAQVEALCAGLRALLGEVEVKVYGYT